MFISDAAVRVVTWAWNRAKSPHYPDTRLESLHNDMIKLKTSKDVDAQDVDVQDVDVCFLVEHPIDLGDVWPVWISNHTVVSGIKMAR